MNWLAPSMRSPSGIKGWFAMKVMERLNATSERTGIERLQILPGHVVCEIGAGHGFGLRHIVDHYAPSRVVCVEISEDFRASLQAVKSDLEQQKSAAGGEGDALPSVEIFDCDARDMAAFLDDGSVDRVFAMNVVYFLEPLEVYLREIYRVLRGSGGVVVFGCKFHRIQDAPHPFVNTEEDRIVELMTAAGLDVTSTRVDVGDPTCHYVELKGVKQ